MTNPWAQRGRIIAQHDMRTSNVVLGFDAIRNHVESRMLENLAECQRESPFFDAGDAIDEAAIAYEDTVLCSGERVKL